MFFPYRKYRVKMCIDFSSEVHIPEYSHYLYFVSCHLWNSESGFSCIRLQLRYYSCALHLIFSLMFPAFRQKWLKQERLECKLLLLLIPPEHDGPLIWCVWGGFYKKKTKTLHWTSYPSSPYLCSPDVSAKVSETVNHIQPQTKHGSVTGRTDGRSSPSFVWTENLRVSPRHFCTFFYLFKDRRARLDTRPRDTPRKANKQRGEKAEEAFVQRNLSQRRSWGPKRRISVPPASGPNQRRPPCTSSILNNHWASKNQRK